jgi:hypothetical protein
LRRLLATFAAQPAAPRMQTQLQATRHSLRLLSILQYLLLLKHSTVLRHKNAEPVLPSNQAKYSFF